MQGVTSIHPLELIISAQRADMTLHLKHLQMHRKVQILEIHFRSSQLKPPRRLRRKNNRGIGGGSRPSSDVEGC